MHLFLQLFNYHSKWIIKYFCYFTFVLPQNCQNTDSMLHVPPETVIYGSLLHSNKICISLCPRAALGLSDHCLVHLIPTYRQKLKSAKPVLRTVKRFKSLFRPHWLDCFWNRCKRSGRAHRDCNLLYQFLWRYVHSYKDSSNLQQQQTVVHCKTQTAPSGQRRCLQEWGQSIL